LKLLINRYCCI